jgi:hypothetical protein
MKASYIILPICILFLVFISCKSKERDNNQGNEFKETEFITVELNNEPETNKNTDKNDFFPINYFNDESIIIEFNINEISLARHTDIDMIQNVIPIYRNESRVIENMDEIEPNQTVIGILDKPFESIELSVLSEFSENTLLKIEDLMNIFDIKLSQNNIEKFESIGDYRYIKIRIENITLFVYKQYMGFKLFIVEYDNDYIYTPMLKSGIGKNEIINLLGNPSAFSDERNIFIYNSNKSLRQINIYFDDDKVKNIQLISWGGI